MTFDEFLEKLDKNNHYYGDIVRSFQRDLERKWVVIEKKGQDLVEVVQRCKDAQRFPVVDKKLGLVFGCDSHAVPRQQLFRYHYYAGGKERPYVDADESADRYISEGHGWFISRMRPRIVVAGIKYRPDQFDKDVFISYQVEQQDLTRDEKLAIIRGERRLR